MGERSPLRILTWHVHGSYLWALAHLPHELVLPVRPDGDSSGGYAGRAGSRPWPDNVVEVPAEEVADLDLDVVMTQSLPTWGDDRRSLLSPNQRDLPRVHIEHDPPRLRPFDQPHPIQDDGLLLVHVTDFNRLMWDSGITPTTVVEHGVAVPEEITYDGSLERGIVVVNDLDRRGRRLGADVFAHVRQRVPLDLVGIGSERLGGLGEVDPVQLPAFLARYRFAGNPIRWTSLGLAVIEAMQVGLPVVGLATTEMPTAVVDGWSGILRTDPDQLAAGMARLLDDPDEAARLGRHARQVARTRFGIDRFVRDWDRLLRDLVADGPAAAGERADEARRTAADQGGPAEDRGDDGGAEPAADLVRARAGSRPPPGEPGHRADRGAPRPVAP